MAASTNNIRIWDDETSGRISGNSGESTNILLNGGGSGNVGIGTTSPSATLDVNGAVMMECVTVSALPSGKKGMCHCVTDATSCTFLGALTGGGSTFCSAVYNGSAWVGG